MSDISPLDQAPARRGRERPAGSVTATQLGLHLALSRQHICTLANVEQWLRDGRPHSTTLETVEVEPPKLHKGEDVVAAIDRLRRRGRELQADLHRIRSAPYPSSDAKQRAREQIEQLAQSGAPNAAALVEHADAKLEELFPRVLVRAQVHNVRRSPAAVAYAEAVDPIAVIAWLFPKELAAALDQEIASEADDKPALSHEARQQAEAEVMSDLLAVERDECWFVWTALSQNLPVEHRADISPLALLGLRLVTTPRALPAPGSSGEHSYEIVKAGR
jgi:hypothetical protein